MTYDEFNVFCRALPATSYVVQWGDSPVWKVGGKVFAIGGWEKTTALHSHLKRLSLILKYCEMSRRLGLLPTWRLEA